MDTLDLEQLALVPWFSKERLPDAPSEPPVDKIKEYVRVPFMKRNRNYPLFYSWVEIVKSVPSPPLVILDAACGRGIIAQVLFLKGHRVYACDIQNYFCGDKEIDFKLVDLNRDFPYPDNFFDIVINCEGLEYLESSIHFLKETARVLKNNGHLLISVPHISSLVGRYNFFKSGILTGYETALFERRNIIYLPLLQELFNETGFRIVHIKGNVPQITKKARLFHALLGRILFPGQNDALKFAHSLIIDAELKKY